MRLRIHTESGSIYEWDQTNKVIVRLHGGDHYKGRAAAEPSTYVMVTEPTQGECWDILWGYGRDEFSPDDAPDHPALQRWTRTSRVVKVEAVSDAS